MGNGLAGVSFYGAWGDFEFDGDGVVSSKSGSPAAVYAWAIVNELINRGYKVTSMMPDLDSRGDRIMGDNLLFTSFCEEKRRRAYIGTKKTIGVCDFSKLTRDDVFIAWDEAGCPCLDFIVHRWVRKSDGENTGDCRSSLGSNWRPDLFIQGCVIEYCLENQIRLIILDADCDLDDSAIASLRSSGLELDVISGYVPFDFSAVYEFSAPSFVTNRLAVFGELMACEVAIDSYVSRNLDSVVCYCPEMDGFSEFWGNVNFRGSIPNFRKPGAYRDAAATLVYPGRAGCERGVIPVQVLESALFGTVPLVSANYGDDFLIDTFGTVGKFLAVRSREDLERKTDELFTNRASRVTITNRIRESLRKKMDVRKFVDSIVC